MNQKISGFFCCKNRDKKWFIASVPLSLFFPGIDRTVLSSKYVLSIVLVWFFMHHTVTLYQSKSYQYVSGTRYNIIVFKSHVSVPSWNISTIKGTVAWDFYLLVLFINRSHLGPCLLHSFFFEFCFEFAKLFEFEIRTALWATAGNQIFLQIPRI